MCILKQLSSLRSGHRRLTGSPTRETQHSRNQHSQIGASSISLRSSSTDKNESNRKINKVNVKYVNVVTDHTFWMPYHMLENLFIGYLLQIKYLHAILTNSRLLIIDTVVFTEDKRGGNITKDHKASTGESC